MISALMYGALVLTVTSLAKDVSSSLELQCPSCEKIHCTPRRASRLRCKGGITRGICNCCPVCAKTESEDCGGDHDYLGKCDRGLYCRPNTNRVLDDYGSLPLTAVGKRRPEGKCTKGGHTCGCYMNVADDCCTDKIAIIGVNNTHCINDKFTIILDIRNS